MNDAVVGPNREDVGVGAKPFSGIQSPARQLIFGARLTQEFRALPPYHPKPRGGSRLLGLPDRVLSERRLQMQDVAAVEEERYLAAAALKLHVGEAAPVVA